jgi:hypothetical protein
MIGSAIGAGYAPGKDWKMKVFLTASAVAIVIAIGSVFVLNTVQEPVSVAYATSGVRL